MNLEGWFPSTIGALNITGSQQVHPLRNGAAAKNAAFKNTSIRYIGSVKWKQSLTAAWAQPFHTSIRIPLSFVSLLFLFLTTYTSCPLQPPPRPLSHSLRVQNIHNSFRISRPSTAPPVYIPSLIDYPNHCFILDVLFIIPLFCFIDVVAKPFRSPF